MKSHRGTKCRAGAKSWMLSYCSSTNYFLELRACCKLQSRSMVRRNRIFKALRRRAWCVRACTSLSSVGMYVCMYVDIRSRSSRSSSRRRHHRHANMRVRLGEGRSSNSRNAPNVKLVIWEVSKPDVDNKDAVLHWRHARARHHIRYHLEELQYLRNAQEVLKTWIK